MSVARSREYVVTLSRPAKLNAARVRTLIMASRLPGI